MMKLLTALIAASIALGVFIIYTQPQYDHIKTVQDQIAQFDAALTNANAMQDLKRDLLSRYNLFTGDDLNRLSRLLPDHVDNVRLVLDLDSMASRYAMAIQNVTVDRQTSVERQDTVIGALSSQAAASDSVTLKFSTEGTYANFVALMEDLESSLRIVDIVQISFDPIGSKDENLLFSEPQYRFEVTLRTYWLK